MRESKISLKKHRFAASVAALSRVKTKSHTLVKGATRSDPAPKEKESILPLKRERRVADAEPLLTLLRDRQTGQRPARRRVRLFLRTARHFCRRRRRRRHLVQDLRQPHVLDKTDEQTHATVSSAQAPQSIPLTPPTQAAFAGPPCAPPREKKIPEMMTEKHGRTSREPPFTAPARGPHAKKPRLSDPNLGSSDRIRGERVGGRGCSCVLFEPENADMMTKFLVKTSERTAAERFGGRLAGFDGKIFSYT